MPACAARSGTVENGQFGSVFRGACRADQATIKIESQFAFQALEPREAPGMAGHTTEMMTLNGCSIEVLRGGSGTPMLFLHGAGGASVWAPYMEALARRFSLIVPSHPGYGRSDTPPWLDSLSDLAYFYLDFINALGLRDFHLAGNSLGGWLAAEIAVRSCDRLRTLTLVSPAGIHVKGVPKGDIFLWDDDAASATPITTRKSPRRGSRRSRPGRRWKWRSRIISPPPSSPGTRGSTIRTCTSGCTGSGCRR
jgi:pimeloyl-ACP methyl ester carboxylesterase